MLRTDAVGDHAHATQRAQDVDMHRADQRANAGTRRAVLHHDYARRGQREDVIPPVRAVGINPGSAIGGTEPRIWMVAA